MIHNFVPRWRFIYVSITSCTSKKHDTLNDLFLGLTIKPVLVSVVLKFATFEHEKLERLNAQYLFINNSKDPD